MIQDEQLHTYETKHGRVGVGRTQHLALANQVLLDTRIPPEGFVPTAADMHPVGRDYGSPPYRHYDEHTFTLPIPGGIKAVTTATITVRALHQLTSGFYVQFLLDALGEEDIRARKLKTAYLALGRVPPELMTSASRSIRIIKKHVSLPPDAGHLDAMEASMDAGPAAPKSGRCRCNSSKSPRNHFWPSTLILLLFLGLSLIGRKNSACL